MELRGLSFEFAGRRGGETRRSSGVFSRFGLGGGSSDDGGIFSRRGGRVRRGGIRTAILLLLLEQPLNGYQLMQEIEKRSDGVWRPSPGATYPALQQLEDEGLVRVEQSGSGRVFHLTDAGRKEAKTHQKEPAPWSMGGDGADADEASNNEIRKEARQLIMALKQIGHAGTSSQRAQTVKVLAQARKSIYRILAEEDE